MTVALTIHQPYPSLIAHGIKEWETRPHPPVGWPGIPDGTRRMPGCRVEPGETVLIHAATQWAKGWLRWYDPDLSKDDEARMDLFGALGVNMSEDPGGSYTYYPWKPDLPLGAVVATARITDVVPIAECDWRSEHICLPWSGELTHHSPMEEPFADRETEHDISDQIPYGDWTPGRWAWRLDDVRLLTEPVREYDADVDADVAKCSTSYCAGANGWDGPEYPTCDGCNANGTRTVPVRGRQGVWRPAPALVAACGVTP